MKNLILKVDVLIGHGRMYSSAPIPHLLLCPQGTLTGLFRCSAPLGGDGQGLSTLNGACSDNLHRREVPPY